jgi:hypothetical protein
MNAALVTQTIQLIIAPVVMVSACGVILNGLLSRYASVNDRLRTMAHERWDLLRTTRGGEAVAAEPDPNVVERLQEIDIQIPQLLRLHHQLRDAALLLYVALLFFIACMFLIAAGTLLDVQPLATATLSCFWRVLSSSCWECFGRRWRSTIRTSRSPTRLSACLRSADRVQRDPTGGCRRSVPMQCFN